MPVRGVGIRSHPDRLLSAYPPGSERRSRSALKWCIALSCLPIEFYTFIGQQAGRLYCNAAEEIAGAAFGAPTRAARLPRALS
jgi:hypothetical protein